MSKAAIIIIKQKSSFICCQTLLNKLEHKHKVTNSNCSPSQTTFPHTSTLFTYFLSLRLFPQLNKHMLVGSWLHFGWSFFNEECINHRDENKLEGFSFWLPDLLERSSWLCAECFYSELLNIQEIKCLFFTKFNVLFSTSSDCCKCKCSMFSSQKPAHISRNPSEVWV